MEGEGSDEVSLQRSVLAHLQAGPSSVQELCSSLGASERAVGTQLARLVAGGMAEEAPGGMEGTTPVYRLAQQRRRRSGGAGKGRPGGNGSLPSPVGGHQGPPQHGFMPGVMPYHPGPPGFYPQLYYPAGMAPYQQPPMGAGGPQWGAPRGPGMPGPPPRQQGGGSVPAGMHMPGPAGAYPHPMQAAYFYPAGPGAMPLAPLTPAVSGSQQRQLPMARSGSGVSASSTGWGGVPLSQSAAEMVAAGLGPSPRSSPRQQAAEERELGAAAAGEAAEGAASSAAAGGEGDHHSCQAAAVAAAGPAAASEGEASKLGAVPREGPGSSGSDDLSDEPGEGAGRSRSVASSSGGEGSGGVRSSPSGSSSGSRRSRNHRLQQECAFYLKTGTCAYGDSCKFAHPFDKAPKVEFNSLGLPLRPGEPDCSFYLKHYRCAFGHTCKFHHPELPTPPPNAVPVFPMHQYPMHQYPQASSTPVLSSVLGLHHKGTAGGSGAAGAAMAAAPAYYMPQHFPGGPHAGFAIRPPAMHPAYAAGPSQGMVGGPPPRSSNQRRGSTASPSSRAAAPGAAAAVPSPLPLPVALPGTSPGSVSGDAMLHTAFPEQHQPAVVAAGPSSSPPAAAAATAVAAAEPVPGIACSPTMPAPIMVFHSPRRAAGLAASLNRLQLSAHVEEEVQEVPEVEGHQGAPAMPAGPTGPPAADGSSPSGSGGGNVGSLAHQQPRAELAAA
ncbi:hypothetical protein ABPG75_006408 [Micractinium tetrahymenae]